MLRSMQLENFKAFGQRTVIPLAPITLIFGQNSSGKSSILQSLNLLKQTRESRDVEALLLPRTENGFADLGSFQEMLFDHELKRTL
jgi:predicted ATPase